MKRLLIKILKFLFGIDVIDLLSKNEKLKFDNNKLSEQNKYLQSEIYKLSELQKSIKETNTKLQDTNTKLQSENKRISQQNKPEQEVGALINEIGKLKEVVSQNQSALKDNTEKETLIKELKKKIDTYKGANKALRHEIAHTKEDIKSIQSSKKENTASIQILDDGNIVEHKGLVLGDRAETSIYEDENKFEYIDEFKYDLKKLHQPEHTEFPTYYVPKIGTPILRWNKSKNTETTGVSEPLLIAGLNRLKEMNPELEVLQNISLSIKNRDYGYRPDIALYWKKHNIYIDIEIDEPYDIRSRKPIHYIGSSDYLRNLYFISQGWIVIRLSEEQVVKDIDSCLKYIAIVLGMISKETIFNEFIEGYIHKSTQRWTYEEALELAKDNYREKYLEIDESNASEVSYNDSNKFEGVPPDEDILPEDDYSELESKFEAIRNKYIRITRLPKETQYIFENAEIEKKEYALGIYGFDLVSEKRSFIPFEEIANIEGLDTPFKYPLLQHIESYNFMDVYNLVKEAIHNSNPIRIEYKDARSYITFRNLTEVSYEIDCKNDLGDLMWGSFNTSKGKKIAAFCMLRMDVRSFFIDRMKAVQVYNARHYGEGYLHGINIALWYPLKKNDMNMAHIISKLIPKHIIENDILAKSTYAHYLLLSGKQEEAIEVYRKYEGERINDNFSWKEMNIKFLRELQEHPENEAPINKALQQLNWN